MRKPFAPHWIMAAAVLCLAIGIPMMSAPGMMQLVALATTGAGIALGATAMGLWWLNRRDGI